jgi:hypothetical protein
VVIVEVARCELEDLRRVLTENEPRHETLFKT